MRDRDRILLTLEERLALAKNSQVTSPETAAKLIQRFSAIPAGEIFCGNADIDILHELTGAFWNFPSVDQESYQGFCHSFQLAMNHDNDFFNAFLTAGCAENTSGSALQGMLPEDDRDPYLPAWGLRINNAMVLLGLMLLDCTRSRMCHKDISFCMQMTLRQYLDALVDLSFQKNGEPDEFRVIQFQFWKETLLKDYDGSKSLKETLAGILNRYIAAWQEFDHLDHIIRCMGALSCYLEQEDTWKVLPQAEKDSIRHFRKALLQYSPELEGRELVEPDNRYLDPAGYYLTLALEYPEDIPDPGSIYLTPGTLRSRLFLSGRDYHPEVLQKLAAKAPFEELRALLEKNISKERLTGAMHEINIAVTDLFILLVDPYLKMEEYCYQKHLT